MPLTASSATQAAHTQTPGICPEATLALHTLSARLVVVVGASGAGKDSLILAWMESFAPPQRPHLARRVITRERHPSEAHEPVSRAAFQQLLAAGRLALHWQAHGLDYGVRWAELAPLAAGRAVLVNGSREHLPQLRRLAPQARVVEVRVPEALRAQRLSQRGREDSPAVAARLARPAPPVQAEVVIDNSGTLHDAVRQLQRWWGTAPAA